MWCRYKHAEVVGTDRNHKHTTTIPVAIMDEVEPMFKTLTDTILLNFFFEVYTQNANESFQRNGVVIMSQI